MDGINRSLINVEETIGKVVGRRVQKSRPMNSITSSKAHARAWQRALPVSRGPKGVFRFKSHEEANEWMWNQMVALKKS